MRCISSRWVEQCLARGDAARMLEPLLLSLLDPGTARVSVLHAGVTRAGHVYSIKCGDNKTVYHGSDSCVSTPRDAGHKKYLNTSDEVSVHKKSFPYKESVSVNPFALVSSESEYNHDPSATPEPKDEESELSRPSSPHSSVAQSVASSPSTPRKSSSRSQSLVTSLLSEIISAAVDQSCFVLDLNQFKFDHETSSDSVNIHPLHSHLLLYHAPVDTRAALFTLHCVQDLVSVQPRQCVSSLATTSLSSHSLPRSTRLIHLLTRHRQAIYGKGFAASLSDTSSFRSSMLLECLLSVSLFYIRSYFPNIQDLSEDDIRGNRELRLEAVTTLTKILTELVGIVKDNGKAFAVYILDLLVRCKLQKVVLHCLLTSVYQLANLDSQQSFTQKILEFNDISEKKENVGSRDNYQDLEAYQVELLKLVMAIIMLEEVISTKKYDECNKKQSALHNSSLLKYHSDQPFSSQPMFLAAVMAALKHSQLRQCHRQWTGLVVSCLPVLGPALTQLVTAVAGTPACACAKIFRTMQPEATTVLINTYSWS